jgi:hypothetical protein
MIEQMQAYFAELYLNHRSYRSRDLLLIVEFIKDLELQALSLSQEPEHDRNAVGFTEALIRTHLFSRKVLLPQVEMRTIVAYTT